MQNTERKGLGITKGPYKLLVNKEGIKPHTIHGENGQILLAYINLHDADEQTEANAKLFFDTLTTANACGLLPSELLKQRDSLLEASAKLIEWSKKYPEGRIYGYGEAVTIEAQLTEVVEGIKQAITNATKQGK